MPDVPSLDPARVAAYAEAIEAALSDEFGTFLDFCTPGRVAALVGPAVRAVADGELAAKDAEIERLREDLSSARAPFRCCPHCVDDPSYHEDNPRDSHDVDCTLCEYPTDLRRRALAAEAKVKAVEALADEWEQKARAANEAAATRVGLYDEEHLRAFYMVMVRRVGELRAALADAPAEGGMSNVTDEEFEEQRRVAAEDAGLVRTGTTPDGRGVYTEPVRVGHCTQHSTFEPHCAWCRVAEHNLHLATTNPAELRAQGGAPPDDDAVVKVAQLAIRAALQDPEFAWLSILTSLSTSKECRELAAACARLRNVTLERADMLLMAELRERR